MKSLLLGMKCVFMDQNVIIYIIQMWLIYEVVGVAIATRLNMFSCCKFKLDNVASARLIFPL